MGNLNYTGYNQIHFSNAHHLLKSKVSKSPPPLAITFHIQHLLQT